ncbi:MAG: DUF2508 family protein [Oscillospiraceae bacterium]|nr:DUF2508 family protein [Oscillospiraceae bacterium]
MRKKLPSPADIRRGELMESIESVKTALCCAYNHFEMTADPKLTEAAIYHILSLRARYDYLIREMKALEAPCEARRESGAQAAFEEVKAVG